MPPDRPGSREALPPPVGGGAQVLFFVGYLALTFVHALLVAGHRVHPLMGRWLSPLARTLHAVLAPLFLQTAGSADSAVVLEIGKCIPGARGKRLLWIPDLQHCHYSRYFSLIERLNREINWRASSLLADRVIVSSKAVGEDLASHWGIRSNVDCWKFPASDTLSARKAPLADPTNPLLVYPAQFWKHKGHLALCQGFARYLEEGGPPETRLVLIGASGPQVEAVRTWIRDHHLTHQIEVSTDVDDSTLFSLLARARALIFPSYFEGWSTTVLEGISLLKPLALSDIPAHREVGLPSSAHFPTGDIAAIAEALRRLLEDEGYRKDLVSRYASLTLPSADSFGLAVAKTMGALTDNAGDSRSGAIPP